MREQPVRHPDPMTQPWSQHHTGRQINGPFRRGRTWGGSRGAWRHVGKSWGLGNLPGRKRQLGIRWGGTLSEPVLGTKLSEFLDTKKVGSAAGLEPSNDICCPCHRGFVAADSNGLRGLCDSWCSGEEKSDLWSLFRRRQSVFLGDRHGR